MMYLNSLMIMARAKMQRFLRDERGDVNIVSIVVLIGVAVLLALVFKNFLGNLLKDMLNSIGDKANGIATNEIT